MKIRKALPGDLSSILDLYAGARVRMRRDGNPTQWGDDRPSPELAEGDIDRGDSYLVIGDKDSVVGTFAFIKGEDPTYASIREGAWIDPGPYGTIHRVAGDGKTKGVFAACLEYCARLVPSLRIDTHRDNGPMKHVIEKNGFTRCGIITVDDGTDRIAYQKVIRPGSGFFLPTDDLAGDGIRLILNHTADAVPEKGWIPAYHFDICLNDLTKVGRCDLRIGYSEKTRHGGNIGYTVFPLWRGNHYAQKAVALMLRQAGKHGMPYLLITCDPSNNASARTCENAGGRMIAREPIPEENEMYGEGKREVLIYRFDIS